MCISPSTRNFPEWLRKEPTMAPRVRAVMHMNGYLFSAMASEHGRADIKGTNISPSEPCFRSYGCIPYSSLGKLIRRGSSLSDLQDGDMPGQGEALRVSLSIDNEENSLYIGQSGLLNVNEINCKFKTPCHGIGPDTCPIAQMHWPHWLLEALEAHQASSYWGAFYLLFPLPATLFSWPFKARTIASFRSQQRCSLIS